ncbi:MAG: cysteine desulfurase [Candidatus Bathyarchaeota archaeon]|uniref:cysteine desulfurase family protein n=1 Tax=Candidatus Bathycorpusculum sp. TaxID=2994959 RepID=UPI0028263B25|nr:cysteine desulfurase [Candidatus Termiticorpusculum sp.]MCL2256982.1 cysteine desulfurase [Candidatus Termiticorpusculum sp.]MCL2292894.1 cysteine desulfurase [Candidatus Termiticorpusculum sp.]
MVENVKELLKLHERITRQVYLDNENSSIVPPVIVEAMLPYFNKIAYGNPTLTHKPGWEAFEVIMTSFQQISKYMDAKVLEEITFTPGESESNNLAIMSSCFAQKEKGKKIIISEIEPINVLHTVEMMKKFGFTVTKIPVDSDGFLNMEKLKEAIDKETIFVSIAAVNNEIGTIQNIKEAVQIVKDKNSQILFHTDATDAYGRIPFSVQDFNVDLATVSSYKIQGPRGVSALYVREGVNLDRIIEGQIGTQKLWPGIENTPLIVGFTKASELAFENFEANTTKMRCLRDKLVDGVFSELSDLRFNGPKGEKRSPDNANISFLRAEGEALTIELSLKGVYLSSGSACSRRLLQPSHVLVAIGRRFEEAHGSVLMKISRYLTEEDIAYVLEVIPEAVNRIRRIVGSTGVE